MKLAPLRFITSRIERKLALLLSLVALVSLVVFGWLAIRSITVAREQNVAELEGQLVNQTNERIKKFVFDKLDSFRVIIADPKVVAISHDQQVYILKSQLQSDRSLLEVSFIRPDGHELWREVRNEDKPMLRVFAADADLVKTVAGGKSYLGQVVWAQNKPRLIIASPITSSLGKVIGILRGEVDLSLLGPLASPANLGQTGYLYLLDQDNRLMATSSNFPSAAFTAGRRMDYAYINRRRLSGADISKEGAEYLISPLADKNVYTLGRQLAPLNWLAVVEWPQAEAMQVLPQIVIRLLAAAAVLLLVLIILSIIIARRFARPLRRLSAAAGNIGQGKLAVDLPIGGSDELGQLARSFGDMTKGLQELEKLKDEFVFIAAHELRTPVTAIRGYTEMLTDLGSGLPPPAREFVQRLQQSGARLAGLVNDLLEVARDQAGRLKCETAAQDLVPIINGVISELTPLLKEKNHIFNFVTSAPSWSVMADKDKLQEVLVNLLSNAIKYTPPSGKIAINLEQRGPEVEIAVVDNGIGIAPDDQAKLFQRFFRVESDETRNIQGTGLGLFIVRQLVERMGGRIWIESAKGQGTTFTFTLKLA